MRSVLLTSLRFIVLGIFTVGCSPRTEVVVEDQSVRPAKIFRVIQSTETDVHEYVGRVQAAETLDISFEVSGPLKELVVLEGQAVKKGDLIAALDPTDYQLALRETEVQLKLVKQDMDRKKKLLPNKIIAQSVVDDAKSQYQLAKVKVEQAREALAGTKIYAPFDAYVAKRFTDNYVNIEPGDKIVRLHNLDYLLVVANFPESNAAYADTAIRSRFVEFPFIPNRRFELEFHEYSGEAANLTQTYEVTYRMENPEDWNILPGMTASLFIEFEKPLSRGNSMQIPTTAVISCQDNQLCVWVFDPESKNVSQRVVEVGTLGGQRLPVLSGLASGELIVAAGASKLQKGMKIRPIGQSEAEL